NAVYNRLLVAPFSYISLINEARPSTRLAFAPKGRSPTWCRKKAEGPAAARFPQATPAVRQGDPGARYGSRARSRLEPPQPPLLLAHRAVPGRRARQARPPGHP